MDDRFPDTDGCPFCGRKQDTSANRVGRACATVIVAVVAFIMLTPLVWVARVAAQWALGL